MADGLDDVPPAPRRARAKTGTRATNPADLPTWVSNLGEPGGFRFRLLRLEPNMRSWPPVRRPIQYEEIERNGAGIYEVQTERLDARNAWRPYGQPRQIVIERTAVQDTAAPNHETDFRDAVLMRLLDRLDQNGHAPASAPNPYSLPGGPAVPAETLDELKATHADQIRQIKQTHAEAMENTRMLWQDRLDSAKSNAAAQAQIAESRIRELEDRARRMEAEIAEVRSKRVDPLAEAIKRMEEAERLRDVMGGTKDPDEHWIAGLLRNPEAVGQIIEKMQRPPGAVGAPSSSPTSLPATSSPSAPPNADVESRKQGLASALEQLIQAGASPEAAYASLAPHVPQAALVAAASVSVDQFCSDLVRPSAPNSRLRDVESKQWLAGLHGVIQRITGAKTPAQEPPKADAEPIVMPRAEVETPDQAIA